MDISISASVASFKSATLSSLTSQGNSPGATGPKAGFEHIGPFGQGGSAVSSIDELEASNAAFMRHYNAKVDSYKTEFSVLGQMRQRIDEMGSVAGALTSLGENTTPAEAKDALKSFISDYNKWDADFDEHFTKGALLEENQAANYARFSLQREVGSIFHGAGNGGFAKGLTDMGVTVGKDGQLSFDEAAFDAAMKQDPKGALQTIRNMAGKVEETTAMLNQPGHMLDNRQGRLTDAVEWAANYQPALEAEFGPGAATRQSMQAMSAYKTAASF